MINYPNHLAKKLSCQFQLTIGRDNQLSRASEILYTMDLAPWYKDNYFFLYRIFNSSASFITNYYKKKTSYTVFYSV